MQTLDDLLAARRTMDYAATAYPHDVFMLAKETYLSKLKRYHDEAENKDSVESFRTSEHNRAEQLALFNDSGPNFNDQGSNDEIHKRTPNQRFKTPGV